MYSRLWTTLFSSTQQQNFEKSIQSIGLTKDELIKARDLEAEGTDDPAKIPAAMCLRKMRYDELNSTEDFEQCAKTIKNTLTPKK